MTLRRPVPNVSESLGPLTLTMDDLAELETLIPDDAIYRRITAGPYEVDSVNDLRASSQNTLPDFSFVVSGLRVSVHPGWASVVSTAEEMNDPARGVADFLRGRQVRRLAGFDTPAKVGWFVAWIAVYYGLTRLVFAAYDRMKPSEGLTVAAFIGSVVVALAWMGSHGIVNRRLPDRVPVILARPERWIDRHGMLLSIIVAIILGVAAIITTVLTS